MANFYIFPESEIPQLLSSAAAHNESDGAETAFEHHKIATPDFNDADHDFLGYMEYLMEQEMIQPPPPHPSNPPFARELNKLTDGGVDWYAFTSSDASKLHARLQRIAITDEGLRSVMGSQHEIDSAFRNAIKAAHQCLLQWLEHVSDGQIGLLTIAI